MILTVMENSNPQLITVSRSINRMNILSKISALTYVSGYSYFLEWLFSVQSEP